MLSVSLAASLLNAETITADYDTGPRVGFDASIGFQAMANGETLSNTTVLTTESTMAFSLPLAVFSWGIGTELLHFEPTVYVGKLSNSEFSGGNLVIGPFQFPGTVGEYSATVFGGGLGIRFKLKDTRFGFGLDFDLLQGSGTAKSWLDSNPDAKQDLDAEFSYLSLGLTVDYNDPNFRPWVFAGMKFIENIFRNPSDSNLDFRVTSNDIFGIRAGVDIRKLFETGLDFEFSLGYFGGIDMGFGLHYRIDLN